MRIIKNEKSLVKLSRPFSLLSVFEKEQKTTDKKRVIAIKSKQKSKSQSFVQGSLEPVLPQFK
jgi:hypothetical protein